MKINAQIFDCDYILLNGKAIIRLFCKTSEGEPVCIFYNNFLPYFYLDINDFSIQDVMFEIQKQGLDAEVVEKYLPVGYISKPKKIIKIIGTDPSRVSEIREWSKKFGTAYEADVLFKYRFMVDHGLRGMGWVEAEGNPVRTTTVKCKAIEATSVKPIEVIKNAPMKYLAIDTETIVEKGGIAEYDIDPICMISMVFHPEHKGKSSVVLLTKQCGGKDTICCKDEKEMMQKFKDILLDYDPDFLVGYNMENYDMPYILKRFEANKISRDIGRSDKQAFTKTYAASQRTSISGRTIIDPYYIIRYLSVYDQPHRFARFDLNTVATALLGRGKADIGSWREMAKLWRSTPEDIEKFVHYCRTDSELVLELVTGHKLVDMNKFIEMSKLSGLILEDLMSGQTARHENALLHELKKKDVIMPCKPKHEAFNDNREIKFKGATVLEPVVGLHQDGCVLVLDFKSMYPSMIMHYNICPSVLIKDDSVDPSNYNLSPIGAKFARKNLREGIFPHVARYYFDTRFEIKRLMKDERDEEKLRILDAKQYALKGMLVSLWGYIGFVGAKFYVPEVAASITAWGRENIAKTKKLVEDNFPVKVIYGDSITKDRFVTIMNKDDMVEIKNIEELFEENKDNKFFRGEKEIIKLNDIKALSIDQKNNKPVWSDINEIIRHRTNKKIYRVNQKLGETVATEDHSIMTLQDNKYVETKPEEMKTRSMIRAGSPDVKHISKIDLYELVKEYKKEIIYKGRKKTAVVHKDDKFIWFGWTNRKNQIKIKRFLSGKDLESLFKLLGMYIAEGSSSTIETSKNKSGSSIASGNIKLLNALKRDYYKLFFNATASVIKSTKQKRHLKYKTVGGLHKEIYYEDGTHKLQMMNETAAVLFKMMCGQKSSGKKIPEIAYHVSDKNKKILLDYMIKGDGSKWADDRYSSDYVKKNFRYDTKSLQLISGLSFMLNQLKIKYTIRYDPKKKTYRITTCTDHKPALNAKITEEEYSGYVYDLSVNGTHMFVDSCGQILLHNTDSVFVKTSIADLDQASQLGEEIAKFVTDNLEGLELQNEKLFKRFLILSKKRYAAWSFTKVDGVWKDKMSMKGIEVVRRDWCKLTTKTMRKVLDIILKEGDISKASKCVRDVTHDISKGLVVLDDLTIIKGVSKPLDQYPGTVPHVELAKKIVQRDPTRGSMVGERLGYVIVRGNQLVSKRAEDPDYVREKGLEIDPKYYIENQVMPPIERIFEVCGISPSELLEGSRQKSLGDMLLSGADSPERTTLKGFNAVVCKKCHWEFRRPPLMGICPECKSGLYFSCDGNMGKFVEFAS